MRWLGIDVGTGGTRALLIDVDGRVCASSTAPHEPMRMERPLWAEQRPENWWDATRTAIAAVLREADVDATTIRALALSGQMHGLVMLDESDRVIRPALIWCDQRSQAQVDAINESLGPENVVVWTANPPLTGFTLPKLLWVRDHEPEQYRRFRRLLLPKDYVRLRLTGDYASDVSDASGTALLDVAHRRWSREMLDGFGIDENVLPTVVESDQITGTVSASAAEATGLAEGTPVAGGAGDQAASAIGNGIVESGVASCTLGTSGVVFAHMTSPAYDPDGRVHTFCHAVPGAWHVMGVTQSAGLSLQWYRNTFAPERDYEDLMREAAGAQPGCSGLYWLPYLMGERTPHLDASARGGWIGITARHRRADMIRSIVEGVSYSQKDCLDIIEALGISVGSIRVSGGGARSPLWRQILADVLGRRVGVLKIEEGSAYGAALIALGASAEAGSVVDVSRRAAQEVAEYFPNVDAQAVYRKGHAAYRRLYPALRSQWG